MKKTIFKDIFIPVISLFLIAAVTTALLALTNLVTAKPIEEIAEETARQSRLKLLPDASSFKEEGNRYTAYDENGNIVGYTFNVSAKGYGGDISVMVGIEGDSMLTGEVYPNVTGVVILGHSETPGLGANCVNESFTGEFKQILPDMGFTVVKDNSGGENGNIDALTGATISSKAVTDAVNQAVSMYKEMIEGGQSNG